MKPKIILGVLMGLLLLVLLATRATSTKQTRAEFVKENAVARAQVPTWSDQAIDFFLHGSMSTEVAPEAVLRAFIKTYPDLFPKADFSHLGLIPDPEFGWPIGFSKKKVAHLGGLSAVGVNCASCHVAQITAKNSDKPVRILGVNSHFDAEGYFGAVTVAEFKTQQPANMKNFLRAYLSDAGSDIPADVFDSAWSAQQQKIEAAMSADPSGAKDVAAGALHKIDGSELGLNGKKVDDADLAALSHSMLKLFHNMRAALHIPDQPPEKIPPLSGFGRNDAFGLLSAALFVAPKPPAPVKYGLVWNVGERKWVHWDGNTRSPLGRNLLASLGLGAPLMGKHADLVFADVKRQTDISEQIQPPKYPWKIDNAAANRGASIYKANCNSCHGGEESDKRLYPATEVGTDPSRAEYFTQEQADRFNKFLAEVEIAGYQASKMTGLRSTQKYWAASMPGVWARSPYLHNGSVRTMEELLTVPNERPKTFHRGSRVYDPEKMGYTDEGAYLFNTAGPGNANTGHDYGTTLALDQKRDLMEYLKSL
jgi:cytochrome c553